MNEDYAIKVEGVSKSFILPHENVSSLKSSIVSFWRRKRGYETQHVLKDISFEIKKGEFFGIVGRNGSGKSTLLKLISQIYTPDKGHVVVNGKLTPFIELGVGFNPELSGRDNVYLNGALLGFNRDEMDAMYDEIVEFAELDRFMDQKLKNYSSGMQVRLAFSIAIRANSDILVLDEVLAVGDEAFQRKCNEYFASIRKSKQTVVLVTHDMDAVRKYCDKAMLIDKGNITFMGSPDEAASQYTLDNFGPRDGDDEKKGKYSAGLSSLVPNMEIVPLSKQVLASKDTFEFELKYEITQDLPVRFGISITDEKSGGSATVINDQIKDDKGDPKLTSTKKGKYSFKYKLPLALFNNRNFTITATLFKVTNGVTENIAYTSGSRVCKFAIRGEPYDNGLLKQKGKWV